MTLRSRIGAKQVVLMLTMALLLLVIAFPLAELVRRSFVVGSEPSLGNYTEVLGDPYNYRLFANTLWLGFLTVAGSIAVGVPAAWLVARTDLAARRWLDTLFVLPFMMPPFVGAIAWIELASPRVGYFNRLWSMLFGTNGGPFDIYSLPGLVLVLTVHSYPLIFLSVRAVLEQVDSSVEEAAAVAGAGPGHIFREITLRLVAPGIIAGALLVFVDTIAEFGIPALIGMQARFFVLTTQIFAYIGTGAFAGIRKAIALSSILMTVTGVGIVLSNLYVRRRRYALADGKGSHNRRVRLGRWRFWVRLALAAFFFTSIGAPTAAVFATAFVRAWGLPFTWENLTLANFHYVLLEYGLTRTAIEDSLVLATAAAMTTTAIGAIAAYLSVKTRLGARHVIDLLASLPHAVPGTVVALAMILTWSGLYGLNLYNTLWIILVAYVVHYLFFAFWSIAAGLGQINTSLEEAARVAGAGWLRTFADILMPLVRPSLIAAAVLVFVPTFRELTISALLWGPNTPTVGVAIYEMQAAGNYPAAAAMAALLLLIVLLMDTALRRANPTALRS